MSANEDFIKKLKQNAASKGAAADKAHAASSRANTKSASQQVQASYANNKAVAQQLKANPSMLTSKITPITMAQTAAGVAKGSIPNAFQNQKESGFERAADIVSSGTSSLVGGAANAMRIATTGKYSPSGMISRGIDKINGTNYTAQNAANQKSFANKMMDNSLLYSQNAKRGLGKIGQAGVDIGSAATQIGLMALTGNAAGALGAGSGATGALTKGLMAIQQAGQGAYDAEKRGAGEGTQALYGLLQGATAYATEGISNVGALGKAFGNGAVDSKVEQASAKAISKFISSDAGRAVANRLATGAEAGLGEALEQNIQDALTPVYQRLTYDKNAKLDAEDMIYNGLVAGAVGGIVGSAGKNNFKALETENDAKAAERLTAAKKAPPVANTTPNLSQVAPNLIKPTQNIAQEAAQAPTVNESAKQVKLPVETENALKTQQGTPEAKANIFPEDSLGAKITTPKSNIPLEASKNTASVQNAQNNELGAANSGDGLGAMDKAFPTYTKLSHTETNTLLNSDIANGVPKEARQPITYDTVSEKESVNNAQQRVALDYDGEKTYLEKATSWTGEDNDTAFEISKKMQEEAKSSGDWAEYTKWRKTIASHGTEIGRALQSFEKYTRNISATDNLINQCVDLVDGANSNGLKLDTNTLIGKVYDYASRAENAYKSGNTQNMIGLLDEIAAQRGYKMSKFTRGMASKLDTIELYDTINRSVMGTVIDEIPPTLGQKISTYQYIAQLTSPRAVERNVLANVAFAEIDRTAHNIGAIIDRPMSILASAENGGSVKDNRTVAYEGGYLLSKAGRKGMVDSGRRAALDINLDIDSGTEGKFEKGTNRTFNRHKTTEGLTGGRRVADVALNGKFGFLNTMNNLEAANAYGQNWADAVQRGGTKGISEASLNKLVKNGGRMTAARAEELTNQEVDYRSFHNDSIIGEASAKVKDFLNIVGIGRGSGRTIGKGKYEADVKDFGIGDLTVKYTRTPGAIATNVAEYTPLGYAKAIYDMGVMADANRNVRAMNGDSGNIHLGYKQYSNADTAVYAQTNAVLALGRSMTGTGLIAACSALAKLGIIVFTDDDDYDKSSYAASEGKSGVQINFSALGRMIEGNKADLEDGDTLINCDNFQPIKSIMELGAREAQMDNKTFLNQCVVAAKTLYNGYADLSMMQTLKSTVNGFKYGGESIDKLTGEGESQSTAVARNTLGKLGSAAAGTVGSGLSGMIPSLVRSAAQAGDNNKRDTSADTSTQKAWNQIKSGVPGLRETLPTKTNSFGENYTYGVSDKQNALNAFLNPGTMTKYNSNPVSEEVDRLYNSTGKASIYPEYKAPKMFENNDTTYSLTSKEKNEFYRNESEQRQELLQKLFNSAYYKSLSDAEKLAEVQKINGYSKDQAKHDLAESKNGTYKESSMYIGVYNAQQAGIQPNDFYAYKKYLKDIDPDGGNATQLQEAKAIDKTGLTTQMKGKLWQMQQDKDTKLDKNPYIGTLAQKGLAPSKTIEIMEAFDTIDDAIGKNYVKADKGPSAAQVKAAYLNQWLTRQGYNANQRAEITDVFETWQMIPVKKISKKATAFVNVNPMP